jgi:fatty acid desaturase
MPIYRYGTQSRGYEDHDMRIVDVVLAILGLAGFVAFLAIIAVYVQELVLVLIFIVCAAMAAFDFAKEIVGRRNGGRDLT